MRYEVINSEVREYAKDCAHEGDIYFFTGGKLIYMGNGILGRKKPSFFKRLKRLFSISKNMEEEE